jgi:hypothetical protein
MSDEKTMGRVIQIDEARSSAISIRSGTSCDYAVKCFGDPYGIGPPFSRRLKFRNASY